MYNIGNVETWRHLQNKAAELGLPLDIMTAEIMHLAALDVLFSGQDSDLLCFRGGTSLHLLHGGYRYSEDLDFAGEKLAPSSAEKLMKRSQSSIEKAITQILGSGRFEWRYPKRKPNPRVFTTWVLFQPPPFRNKYRLKLEFGHFAVHEPKFFPIRSDLDLLGKRTLVSGLAPKELLVEKTTAVFGRPYLKGRDFFDIWYLHHILQAPLDTHLLHEKLKDYHEQPPVKSIKRKLAGLTPSLLKAEMDRFLPQAHRAKLKENGYRDILSTSLSVLDKALDSCEAG
jgi:nucleotidyltransferase AbiEii toxin of type IV toxin-antitoxin system